MIEPYEFTKEKQEVIDKLIDDKVEDLVNHHVGFSSTRPGFLFVADRLYFQYQNLTRDAGLHEVFAVCFARTSDVRSVPLDWDGLAGVHLILSGFFFYRSRCPEFPQQNPGLSKRPYTSSPPGYQTSESYIHHASLGLRSNLSALRYITPLWRGWQARIRGCVRRSRGQVIGTRLLRLYLEVRDRLGRLGYCGRFLGYRIRRAHDEQDLP